MNKVIASRIKELRVRKSFSQSELSNESGLSLRTIQRIENGETEPLGDSVKKIAKVLGVIPEELIDWEIEEDETFLQTLNISALSFLLFPILGIIIPYILWRTRKSRIKGLNQVGRELVNFQITWNLVYYLILFITTTAAFQIRNYEWVFIISVSIFYYGMYAINILLILINTLLIHRGKEIWYKPKISFLRA